MIEILIYNILFFFTSLFTIVVIFNTFAGPLFRKSKTINNEYMIDVLIPARNEERIIEKCLHHVMKQDYDNFRVTVLDDNSEDKTSEIVSNLMKKYSKLKIIKGKPLPNGWLGKNWACHQLSEQATGDLLLFLDSDCLIENWVLNSTATYMKKYNLSLLSSFPTQVIDKFSVELVVPLMNWLLLTFLPLRLVFLSPWLSFVAANGQFMCFRKKDYEKIHGHKSVATKVVEDMELARLVKSNRMKMMTFLGWKSIRCIMYNSFKDSINGFSKNFYPGFNTNPFIFIILLMFFSIIFICPFFISPFFNIYILLSALIIMQRFLLSIICRQNLIINTLLHPVQMIIMIYVGLVSLIKNKKKNVVWKGRTL